MPTTKTHGKLTAIFWKETGGSFVDLSGSSRQVTVSESSSEIDTTTRDDMIANTTSQLAGPPSRTVTLNGLDTTPANSRTWHDSALGDTGTLLMYPLGTGSSKPYEYADGVLLEQTYESPFDGPATWSLNWRLNTDLTDATTP